MDNGVARRAGSLIREPSLIWNFWETDYKTGRTETIIRFLNRTDVCDKQGGSLATSSASDRYFTDTPEHIHFYFSFFFLYFVVVGSVR